MKNYSKLLSVLHFVVLLAVIWWNYYSNTGQINNTTVGEISDKYDSLFTPDGYAFSIWGLIYIGLLASSIYFLYCAFSKSKASDVVLKAAPTLIVAHLCNAAWLWFWLNEETGISVLIMLVILVSLSITVLRLNMERWDAPVRYMALVWWPIDLYFGWISVATIANISAHLNGIGWDGGISEITWAIITMALATIVGILIIFLRNMREVAGVIVWALIAIAIRHWDKISELQWTAMICALLLFVLMLAHAYKHRATLPLIRKDKPKEVE